MSGHSKWHNIQGKKGKKDAARAGSFTKLCSAITVAARAGGGDVGMNFSLRLAVEKAHEANVPKDNIERAIQRGIGALAGSSDIHEILYEGYAHGGVAILVETMTDNVTRTAGDMKHLFGKHGGSLGGPGAVQWQFTRLGVVRLGKDQGTKIKEQDNELLLMDAGMSDLMESEFGVEIRCPIPAFQKVLEVVQSLGVTPESSGFEWVPKETVAIDEAASQSLAEFVEALDELDDVKEVYTNEA